MKTTINDDKKLRRPVPTVFVLILYICVRAQALGAWHFEEAKGEQHEAALVHFVSFLHIDVDDSQQGGVDSRGEVLIGT